MKKKKKKKKRLDEEKNLDCNQIKSFKNLEIMKEKNKKKKI